MVNAYSSPAFEGAVLAICPNYTFRIANSDLIGLIITIMSSWHEQMLKRVMQLKTQIANVEQERQETETSCWLDPEDEVLIQRYLDLGNMLDDLKEQLASAERDELRARENESQ